MKRLVLVVIAGVVAWVLYLAFTSSHGNGTRVETAGERRTQRDERLELEVGDAPGATARVAAQANDSTPDAFDSELTIEVVDAQTKRPLPGARVFVQRDDIGHDEYERIARSYFQASPDFARRVSHEYTADERGLVRTPVPTHPINVWGDLGHRHGWSDVEPGTNHLRLELERQICLIVEVVDAAGQPRPGIRVGVFENPFFDWDLNADSTTDENGRAEFNDLGSWVDSPGSRLRVSLTQVASTPEYVETSVATLPAEPIRLVAPETGAIEVRTTDASGNALDALAEAWIDVDAEAGVTPPFGLAHAGRTSFVMEAGAARFDGVGLALRWTAGVEADGLVFTARHFQGPRTAGEAVRVGVPLTAAEANVIARLVDPSGAPVVGAVVHLLGRNRWGGVSQLSGYHGGITQADGRFVTQVSPDQLGDARSSEVSFLAVGSAGSLRGRSEWPAPREVRDSTVRDEFDFGVVPCAPDTSFCSGKVVDASGNPAPSAWITGRAEPSDDCVALARAANDATFELWAPPDSERLRLMAAPYSWGQVAATVVSRGQRDVVLQLEAPLEAARIKGQLLAPPCVRVGNSIFRLEFEGGRSFRRWAELDDTGAFTLAHVPVGVCRMAYEFDGVELATLPPVQTVAGKCIELAPIDLRGKLLELSVRVVGPTGAPILGATVNTTRNDDYLTTATTNENGFATLPVLEPTSDLVVAAPGHRARAFERVSSGAELALALGSAVIVRAANTQGIGADYVLAVELAYAGDDVADSLSERFTLLLPRSGAVEDVVPALGIHRIVGAALVHRTSGARFTVPGADRGSVELVAAPEESVVSLDRAALEVAIAESRRR